MVFYFIFLSTDWYLSTAWGLRTTVLHIHKLELKARTNSPKTPPNSFKVSKTEQTYESSTTTIWKTNSTKLTPRRSLQLYSSASSFYAIVVTLHKASKRYCNGPEQNANRSSTGERMLTSLTPIQKWLRCTGFLEPCGDRPVWHLPTRRPQVWRFAISTPKEGTSHRSSVLCWVSPSSPFVSTKEKVQHLRERQFKFPMLHSESLNEHLY